MGHLHMTSSSCNGWLQLRVKRRQSESQGECRDGEKRCAEKRQKSAKGTLAFATERPPDWARMPTTSITQSKSVLFSL
jgi:hypothetical protein